MTLTRWEVRWAEIIGRTLIPKGVCGGVLDAVPAGDRLADETRTTAGPVAFLYRLALLIVWWSPPFVVGRWCTFGSLPDAERVKALEALLSAKNYELRMIVTVLKITFCSTVLSEPALMVRLNAYGMAETPMPLPAPQAERVSR